MTTNTQVPVLITWDVDPSPRLPCENKKLSLKIATDLCNELGIQVTFFVTANAEQATPTSLERIQTFGHEIGCHGLTHGDEENYDQMSEVMQRTYIEEATGKLESLAGTPIRVFRSPRVKTSACTLKLLSEYGYWADSSVCSQRIDFVSSNLINSGWVIAPRKPYHPRHDNAFKKGEIPIWEVPVSAVVIPFISASLNILGLSATKALFRLLYAEAIRTGKPIVYLAHPTEFTSGRQRTFQLREFSPTHIRAHGFLIRNLLYRMDRQTWLKCTRELFAYMASFSDVVFMSVGAYTAHTLKQANNLTVPVHL
jgi:peptidoglycan/xylan/chitin deacetylase (PgdA/CDA1 family)